MLIFTRPKLNADIERFHKLRSEVLHQEYLSGNLDDLETSAIKTNDDEMAINYLLNKKNIKNSSKLIFKDLSKVSFGLAISVVIVYLIQYIKFL